MSVLSDEAAGTLKTWFTAKEYQAPLLLPGPWKALQETVQKALAPRDQYIFETEARSISIKEIRTALRAITTTTPFGSRLIVLPDCERLSLPAAQALLKTLEEPNAGNRWLLTTRYPRRLLPTIRSRVQILKIQTPSLPPAAGGLPLRKGEQAVEVDPVKLLTSKNRRALAPEELEAITTTIEGRLRRGQTGGASYRALLRLRDYYKIRSLGGNEKLAADVLLASLVELGQVEFRR